MELYIHIPYCVKKCDYCDFLSFPCGRLEKYPAACNKVEAYVDALVKEMDRYAGWTRQTVEKTKGKPAFSIDLGTVSSVFIGGGTPSVLPVELMERVLKAVKGFPRLESCEYTIECNPGTLTHEKLELYRSYGVNRISLGLQSPDNEELKCLGRIHTFEDFLESYRMIREMGFASINVDLMSGLPGQSADKFAENLKKVIELAPEHISAYSLIIEEGTPFYEIYGDGRQDASHMPLPDEDEERRAYHLTQSLLKTAGYEHYEISNYAKPGFKCVHNLGYWTGVPYLGCGLGAASLVDHVRYKNSSDLDEYVSDPFVSKKIEEVLKKESCISEFIILHLRLMKGFSLDEFQDSFGKSFLERYKDKVEKFTRLNLMCVNDGRVYLSDEGIDVSNSIMSEFV